MVFARVQFSTAYHSNGMLDIYVKDGFCKGQASLDLKEWFANISARGMLVGKEYRCVDVLFTFEPAFNVGATGFAQDGPMAVTYSKLLQLDVKLNEKWEN